MTAEHADLHVPQPHRGRFPGSGRRWKLLLFLLLPLLILALLGLFASRLDMAPRMLAQRIDGDMRNLPRPLDQAAALLSRMLRTLDRDPPVPHLLPAMTIGAQAVPAASAHPAGGRTVLVASAAEAMQAIQGAAPGDDILLLPGRYRFENHAPAALRAGGPEQPITVRAPRPGSVIIELAARDGFKVMAPWWRFENLSIRGACDDPADCDHAFHVLGKGGHFSLRNSVLVDFNRHILAGAFKGESPDDGLVEGNTLANSGLRRTAQAVAPITIEDAGGWTVRANLVRDFIKTDGDGISRGMAVAGAGHRIERNIILCESVLNGTPGRRIGIAAAGAIRISANLVSSCSDEGMQLEGAGLTVLHNTLIDTAGMDLGAKTNDADVRGNLVDGRIRAANAMPGIGQRNLDTSALRLYLGRHPVRELFHDASVLDLAWRVDRLPGLPRAAQQAEAPDLCAAQRPAAPLYGAFENFAGCLR